VYMAREKARLPALEERRTVSDHVADALREAIIAGQFEDGEELNQVELAASFNVSRVPVREALRRLEAEGLVNAEAHRRAVVIGFDRDRINEAFEIRALLETYALERSAAQLGPADFKELDRICDEADSIEDHHDWLEHNRAFHRAVLEPSGAKTAITLSEQLSHQVERYVRRSGGALHRPKEAGREHRELVAALKAGEVQRAAEILRGHILHTRERVIESLPEPRPWVGPAATENDKADTGSDGTRATRKARPLSDATAD
jgi:DNA-binding GntR family transcriptional regulator